jgi:MOSC domain-containing protein YiiM
MAAAEVVSVSLSAKHNFSKIPVEGIRLLAGLGVDGDAHCGALVRHRYRVRQDPTQPNLCQVHLLQAELFDELAAAGIAIAPGQMGENVTTRGVELLTLPTGTLLTLGDEAVVEVTGLRSPCVQINTFRAGLLQAVVGKDAEGNVVRKAGIMGIVRSGGVVKPGDAISVERPEPPWRPLVCV